MPCLRVLSTIVEPWRFSLLWLGDQRSGTNMAYDIADFFAQRERDRYAMHSQHLNEQLVRDLKAIVYDVGSHRGKGHYLYDREGTRYLDLFSGYGVLAIGPN